MGRPAPLDELDGHLDRIAGWGMNCLRLVTTWEAIEHAGPGEYDAAYLDYFAEAGAAGRRPWAVVFVDPTRTRGVVDRRGCACRFWALRAGGARAGALRAGGAVALDTQDWPENYQRVLVATMWTLFYGGDTSRPSYGVQRELQDGNIGRRRRPGECVADLDYVLGYETPLRSPATATSAGACGR